jgi:hypothetical protein
MAILESDASSGSNTSGSESDDLETSRVQKRKAKNREKQRHFRACKAEHLS